jgi:hypothetical protein
MWLKNNFSQPGLWSIQPNFAFKKLKFKDTVLLVKRMQDSKIQAVLTVSSGQLEPGCSLDI